MTPAEVHARFIAILARAAERRRQQEAATAARLRAMPLAASLRRGTNGIFFGTHTGRRARARRKRARRESAPLPPGPLPPPSVLDAGLGWFSASCPRCGAALDDDTGHRCQRGGAGD